MTLDDELQAFNKEVAANLPAGVLASISDCLAELRDRGIASRALPEGGFAPDFTLLDSNGRPVDLASLLRSGPVIVVFYRGSWCPYCNLELRAYQRILPRIKAAGASLVAISPQRPEGGLAMRDNNRIDFPILFDPGARVAHAFGLVFELPAELEQVYRGFGVDLPTENEEAGWRLPIPATYVIAPDSRIVKAGVEVDWTTRMEPETALAAVESLAECARL